MGIMQVCSFMARAQKLMIRRSKVIDSKRCQPPSRAVPYRPEGVAAKCQLCVTERTEKEVRTLECSEEKTPKEAQEEER